MPFQGVDRVIGGADILDVGLLDDAADGELRIVLKHIGGLVPDRLCVLHGQRLGDAEILVKLKVGPVIHRVADRHLEGFREFDKLFIRIRIAGYDIFRNTVRAHDSPLVVVAEVGAVRILSAEPYFRDVVIAAVLINLPRRDVAVIVDNRHLLRVIVEEMLRCFILQHEIFVHECFHVRVPP